MKANFIAACVLTCTLSCNSSEQQPSATVDMRAFTDIQAPSYDMTFVPPPVKAYIYIPDNDRNRLSIIDNVTNSLIPESVSGLQPNSFGIAVTSQRAYVTHDDVTIVDLTSNPKRINGVITRDKLCGGAVTDQIAVTPDEKKAYVTCFTVGSSPCNQIGVFDTQTNSVSKIITTGSPSSCSFGIAVSPNGQRTYVLRQSGVTVIDAATDNVITTIPNVPGEVGLAVSSDSKILYVANSSGSVSVIDTVANAVITNIAVGKSPAGVAVTPGVFTASLVYVTNSGDNTVSVISNNAVIASVPVGVRPAGIAITPDGRKAYVINFGSKNVSIIDTQINKVIDTLPSGGSYVFGKFISPALP